MLRVRTVSRWTAIHLALGLCLLVGLLVRAQQGATLSSSNLASADLATAFVCPMHPDYTLDIAGSCPRCGMALVRGAPFDVRDYGLELTTEPAVVRAGQPARWRFRIVHPGTAERILKFETVHERQYHLFVISHDMTQFQHIHPELQPATVGLQPGRERPAARVRGREAPVAESGLPGGRD